MAPSCGLIWSGVVPLDRWVLRQSGVYTSWVLAGHRQARMALSETHISWVDFAPHVTLQCLGDGASSSYWQQKADSARIWAEAEFLVLQGGGQ